MFNIVDLHSVWDSRLIAKSLRTIPQNYTRPLPSRRIESALRGTIYDPYVRQIMFEGILGRFEPFIEDWLTCPLDQLFKSSRPYPPPNKLLQHPFRSNALKQVAITGEARRTPPKDLPPTDDGIVCPYAWASPLHQLNCDIIWPAELDNPDYARGSKYLELDTPEYAGRIKDEWLVEQLLAMGGIRLAAILNYLFADIDAGYVTHSLESMLQ